MSVTANSKSVAARRARRAALAAVALLAAQLATPAFAGPNEQVKRIYERIAGVPPAASDVTYLQTNCISGGTANLTCAAQYATSAATFYSVTLKNWVIPWTNRDQTVFAPFNDYAATVIGMVRDDVPFNTLLSADLLYTVNVSKDPNAASMQALPAPSNSNNNHYANAETEGANLMTDLVATTQSGTYGTPTGATAGVLTSYAAEAAFFINGTNRAMFRFTMINHFCNDMPTLMDTTRPSDRIRQDVARSPGGDSRLFLNNCVGCHSGMDPMVQAFAYYNFNGTLGTTMNTGTMQYTQGMVQPKYLINFNNFIYGFVTPDDSWSNRWRTGPNAALGWSPTLPGSGNGAKSLGTELESSTTFAQCQVAKVFQAVCFRAPASAADLSTVASMTSSFTSNGYKLKAMFQQAAVACPGS
jgi:hypothetical protein